MASESNNQSVFQLLEGLSAAQKERVLALGEKQHVKCGDVLFPLGGEADRLFLVESGRVALLMPLNVKGDEKDVFLEEEGRGETVGWSAMVAPHHFTLKARASVDAEVIALPRVKLEELFKVDRDIAAVLLRNLATMVGQRLQKVQAMWIREIQRAIDARFGAR